MALDTSVSGWLDELRYARENNRKYMHGYRDDLKNFVGTGYKEAFGRSQPENHTLEWFSLMRAQCLMGNPRFRFSTDVPGDPQLRAQAYSYAVTNWARQTRMRNLNERLLMDWGFRRAVCLVTSEPRPGYAEEEDPPYWPAAYSIDPMRFRADPAATNPETWQWSAHLNIVSRRQLLDLASDSKSGWNERAINMLAEMNVKKFRDDTTQIPERDEVAYWEIWAPSVELNESKGPRKGFHGTLFTVVDEQALDVGWLRNPRPYFGPRAGPYVVSGDYIVPGDAMPLSHVVATKSQTDHVNRIKRATIRAIEAYKKLILIRNGSNLESKIKDGKDLFVYSYDDADIKSNVVQMEIAGATEQHFAAAQDAHGTLDRVSGMTDEMRGESQVGVKATQAAIAAQAGNTRTSFDVAKFRDFITEIGRRVGYYFARDHDVEMELPPEIASLVPHPKTGMPLSAAKLRGGQAKGESLDEYETLRLAVVAGSTERDVATDVQLKDQVMSMTVQEVAALGPQTAPFIDWQTILDARADYYEMPELKHIVNIEAMGAIGAAMMQAGQQQGGTPPQPGQGAQPRVVAAPSGNKPTQTLPQRMAARAGSGPQSGQQTAKVKPPAKVGAA